MNEKLYEDLTEKIIKCFYRVYDALKEGFFSLCKSVAILPT